MVSLLLFTVMFFGVFPLLGWLFTLTFKILGIALASTGYWELLMTGALVWLILGLFIVMTALMLVNETSRSKTSGRKRHEEGKEG